MPLYLSQQTLKEAVNRLGISSAQASHGDYLVFKRAFKIARDDAARRQKPLPNTVVTGIRSMPFLQGHIDIGLWVPPQRVLQSVGEDAPTTCMQILMGRRRAQVIEHDRFLATPYFVAFGARRDNTAGYRECRWPTHGPSDTVPRSQKMSRKPLVLVENTRPAEYRFEPRSQRELEAFYIITGAQKDFSGEKPRLLDTAVWWFRFTDLEERFGNEPLPAQLVQAFIEDFDFTTTEIAALFEPMGTENILPGLTSVDDAEHREEL